MRPHHPTHSRVCILHGVWSSPKDSIEYHNITARADSYVDRAARFRRHNLNLDLRSGHFLVSNEVRLSRLIEEYLGPKFGKDRNLLHLEKLRFGYEAYCSWGVCCSVRVWSCYMVEALI